MIKTLVAGILISAVTISPPVAISASATARFNASAAVGATTGDIATERIGDAFASLPQTGVDAAGAAAAMPPAKGDRPRTSDCASATWPNIDASCLSTADGSPAPRARAITIGYQTGASTTVLIRIPGAEVAQR